MDGMVPLSVNFPDDPGARSRGATLAHIMFPRRLFLSFSRSSVLIIAVFCSPTNESCYSNDCDFLLPS